MMHVDLGEGAWLNLGKAWIPREEADALLASVRAETPWKNQDAILFGKRIPQPRLVAWMGPTGFNYRYSGTDNFATPWAPSVDHLRDKLSEFEAFNAVFLNLYRGEKDSIGYHSDDDAIFGVDPVIASVTLGVARRFKIQHKVTRVVRDLKLDHGDLLVMGGTMQRHYLHAVPKEGKATGERINLTFRRLVKV